jgi:hypothetical protein
MRNITRKSVSITALYIVCPAFAESLWISWALSEAWGHF